MDRSELYEEIEDEVTEIGPRFRRLAEESARMFAALPD